MKENGEMEQEGENVIEDKFLCLTILTQALLIRCYTITALSIKLILGESDPVVHSHLKLSRYAWWKIRIDDRSVFSLFV